MILCNHNIIALEAADVSIWESFHPKIKMKKYEFLTDEPHVPIKK